MKRSVLKICLFIIVSTSIQIKADDDFDIITQIIIPIISANNSKIPEQISELEGLWFLGGSDLQEHHTWDGIISINSSGSLESGTLNSSLGSSTVFTNSTLIADASGKVTGTLTEDGVATAYTMQLNEQKNFMAGEGNATDGNESGLFVFVKNSTGNNVANLEGEWFLAGSDIPGHHTWDGIVSFDNSGSLSSGTLNSSEGGSTSFTNGSFNIADSGKITGSLTEDSVITNFTMQMNAQKDLMAGEGNATDGNEGGIFIFVKKSTGNTSADLEGVWFLGGSDLQEHHTWDGVISFDNSGSLINGTLNSSDDSSNGGTTAFTNSSLIVDDTGKITGSLTEDGVTTNFTMQLNAQKNIMAGEGNSTDGNESGVFIFVKQ